MPTFLLRIFQRQIAFQCRAVLLGAHDFNSAGVTTDVTRTWVAVQNILNGAANISKTMWGQGGKLAAEREPLRKSLGVSDDSPLREVVMRNNFEHFDERVDHWWRNSKNHNHLDMGVLPPDAMQGMDATDMFRVFDPTTSDIVFWGERFNINTLAEAAAKLLPIATQESMKSHMDGPPSSGGGGQ